MTTGYAEDGRAGERFKNYFEERAKGGAALIIIGAVPLMKPAEP
jgi:2,4-dienoyl-CoA reductase-like NADH-dependent reductase (Old Yellow Enzyme family)